MGSVRKYKILITDDNKSYLKALKLQINDILKGQIECIDEVYNGEDAIAIVKKKFYHVVFMDIDMPGINGIDATKIINQNFPQIHIVALSMHDEFHFVEKMIAAGSRTFISKDKLDEESILKVFNTFDKYFI